MPTGIAHGTVTVVSEGRPFEVTTFRRDVATDGRHATVAFSDELAEDAARRDFTMNALYCRPDGAVIDPLGGLADLRAGRVRFVGDPAARIAEDYLRILRFFRIHAWYGDPAGGLDPEGLAACAGAAGGPRPALARARRRRDGEAPRRARPGARRRRHGGHRHPRARPARRRRARARAPRRRRGRRRRRAALAAPRSSPSAGGPTGPTRLRLSRADVRALEATAAALAAGAPPAAAAWRFGAEAARDAALIRAAALGAPPPAGLEAEIARGARRASSRWPPPTSAWKAPRSAGR